MNTEELFEACAKAYDVQDKHSAGLLAVIMVVEKAMREDGYVKLPAEWYIEDDGFGDPSIWMPLSETDPHHDWDTCIGIRFMAGDAKVEKPVADWLWENIRKEES